MMAGGVCEECGRDMYGSECTACSMEDYESLKRMLRDKGWKEQRGGEGYVNGEYGTSFAKDCRVISIGYTDFLDEEEYEDLFGSDD